MNALNNLSYESTLNFNYAPDAQPSLNQVVIPNSLKGIQKHKSQCSTREFARTSNDPTNRSDLKLENILPQGIRRSTRSNRNEISLSIQKCAGNTIDTQEFDALVQVACSIFRKYELKNLT